MLLPKTIFFKNEVTKQVTFLSIADNVQFFVHFTHHRYRRHCTHVPLQSYWCLQSSVSQNAFTDEQQLASAISDTVTAFSPDICLIYPAVLRDVLRSLVPHCACSGPTSRAASIRRMGRATTQNNADFLCLVRWPALGAWSGRVRQARARTAEKRRRPPGTVPATITRLNGGAECGCLKWMRWLGPRPRQPPPWEAVTQVGTTREMSQGRPRQRCYGSVASVLNVKRRGRLSRETARYLEYTAISVWP